MNYHHKPLDVVERELKTCLANGLSDDFATKRYAENGPNKLKEKKKKGIVLNANEKQNRNA